MSEFQLDSIESAIEAIKKGEVIIVVDDEDRENEGDFICAAEAVTPEIINFMRKEGGGLICAPLIEERCEELGLNLMVGKNTVLHETPFTVSVDLIGHGCTTGISTHDRSKTIQALVNPNTNPEELGKPGHIFPLKAKKGGVLRRSGHTEASCDLARLAGFKPAGVLVEILNDEGTMARLPDLIKVAKKHDLKLISIEDLIRYRLQKDSLIEKVLSKKVNTTHGEFDLHIFKQLHTDDLHYVLTKGEWKEGDEVLVRIQASNIPMDVFGLEDANKNSINDYIKLISDEGKGAIIYMNQEDHDNATIDSFSDKPSKPKGMDHRDFGIGAQILRELSLTKIKLVTNNKKRRAGIDGYGIEISGHHNV